MLAWRRCAPSPTRHNADVRLQTNMVLRGLNALVLAWQVTRFVTLGTTFERYWLAAFPLAVALPFGIALYSMIRPPRLRALAMVTNLLLLGIALFVLLPVFTIYGALHYAAARVLEGNVAWMFTVVFWALDVTVAACNVIHLRQARSARSSNAAI